jgi:putative sterol carrier protein
MTVATAREYFEERIPDVLQERGERLRNIGAVYEFQITGDSGGIWTLDLKNEPVTIEEKGANEADCTVVMQDASFVEMINGELKPQMAFLTGKLKVTGNMGLALKLTMLFD